MFCNAKIRFSIIPAHKYCCWTLPPSEVLSFATLVERRKEMEKSVYGKFDFSIGKHHNSEFTNIHFSKHKFFHSRFSCLSSSAFAWLSAFRGSLTSMKRALQMKGNERSFDECWKHIRADFPFETAQKRELRVQSSLYWRSALIGRVVKAG